MTLYGKWEQKQPGVSVEKTAKRTRGNESPVTLPNNTNDPNEIGRVQVGDVINYTVTIKNTGKVTFGNNIHDYRFTDTFSNATGDLIQIDEDGKQIGKVESGKRPPNISLGDMKPGDTKTLYYRYMVRSGDVGQQINNSATAEIKSGTGAGKITRSSNVRVLVEAPEPETATLRFEFKSGTDGKDLPASDMPPVPNDVTEEVGTAVQPQSAGNVLRRWLYSEGLELLREEPVQDGSFLYTVMQLRAGSPAPLTPGQEYASPALLQSGNPLVGAYLARVETALIATVEGLTGAEKQRPERLAYFSQALHEIQEMRKHYGDNS